MRLSVMCVFFLCCLPVLRAQERLPATVSSPDSSRFLYPLIMHYEGSNTDVDLNYRYLLEQLAEELQRHADWRLHIRGHVCCGPSEKISERRAKGAYDFLLRLGVPAERMDFKGYSDLMPIAFPEKTEEDQNANRRVDFVIYR